MGAIGTAMPGSVPAVGAPGTDYATQIDLFLTEVKTRLESKVALSSIQPGSLDLSNNPLSNAQYVGLYPTTTTPATPANSLQQYNGDLYWISGGASVVQLTSGAALNAASLAGITGDYGGGNPAQFRYVTANTEYYAYTSFAGGTYAYLWTLGLDVAGASTGSNRIRILNSGANYTLTLPTATPGSTQLVQMSSAGALTTSNALANNANLTLSGTGHVARGNAKVSVPLVNTLTLQTVATVTFNAGQPGVNFSTNAAGYCYIPLLGSTDENVTIQQVDILNSFVGSGNWTARLYTASAQFGTFIAIGGSATSFTSGTTPATITTGLPVSLNSGDTLAVLITMGATMSGSAYSARVTTSVT